MGALVDRVESLDRTVRIGIIGKYVNLPDAYLSVVEALRHAGFHHGAEVEIDWIHAEQVPGLLDDATACATSTASSSPAASASGASRA